MTSHVDRLVCDLVAILVTGMMRACEDSTEFPAENMKCVLCVLCELLVQPHSRATDDRDVPQARVAGI
eukprot:4955165-Prymnesium_polylepis.1